LSSSDVTPRWLDLAGAAKYTSMSRKTLMVHIKSGEIYASHKGGKWYVDKDSIDTFHLGNNVQIEETVARILGHR
jgi:hypothetical protein